MSKKVKCCECVNFTEYYAPGKVTDRNIDYAKRVLEIIKRFGHCDVTDNRKSRNQEQYCKYYEKSEYRSFPERTIKRLENTINEYEKKKQVVQPEYVKYFMRKFMKVM